MPNWANTKYIAVGDKEQLNKLYDLMKELENMKSPGLEDNDFGSSWFGNLIIKLGGDVKKVNCRGKWYNLELKDHCLYIDAISAWNELGDVRHFIERVFPKIQLYYQCEEEGNCIYTTNDSTGNYFPERYYLWVEDEDLSEYYDSLESLVKAVEYLTGIKDITTLESCKTALEKFSQSNDDREYTIQEFQIVK